MSYLAIIDFGSQTTHLIGRRLKDLGIQAEIIDPKEALSRVKTNPPAGIILSGGPASVYEAKAPKIDKAVFALGIPILGICYGWQLIAHLFGGKVKSGHKEYGPANLRVQDFHHLFYGLPDTTRVFESHGDTVIKLPAGFEVIASTETVKLAAVQSVFPRRRQNVLSPSKETLIFGVQFHPEAFHTEHGQIMLKNFATRICNLAVKPSKLDVNAMIEEIRQKAGAKKVIGAFSGGTDSAVAGALTARAIGRQFIPFYIASGLMRQGTEERIKKIFPKVLGVKINIIKAHSLFLERLQGIIEPEQKRKAIGRLYIELFEREAKKYKDIKYLLQGTTYADFIHSQGNARSALIKSHHNAGGLPQKMKLKLLEPIRYYYTDEVRKIGLKLGLPKEVVCQQPFPGPGHAVRIMGEVTAKRLEQQSQADSILMEELNQAGWYGRVFQSWTVMTGAMSTAIKGDSRFYGEVVALRIINSQDRMSADWARAPYELLAKISTRLVNEVPGISRVVYDVTSKPPATMEWE